MPKYLLLNPLYGDNFGVTAQEVIESLEEFGLTYIFSNDTKGIPAIYATSNSKFLIERMCTEVELDGSIIEFTSIYDQKIED
jgi:chromosome segregation and condensation protein ScpB